MQHIPQCFECVHYQETGGTPEHPHTCNAFPNGIPKPIFDNEVSHTQPYEGDNGILYQPLPGVEE